MCYFHWDNSKTFFLGFQYKVLHLLTEIKDGIKNVANLLKADNTSFRLTQYDNCDEFSDKTTDRSVVSLHTLLLKKLGYSYLLIRIFFTGRFPHCYCVPPNIRKEKIRDHPFMWDLGVYLPLASPLSPSPLLFFKILGKALTCLKKCP